MTAFAVGNSDAPIQRRTVLAAAPSLGVELHPWMADGLCTDADPELWFPEGTQPAEIAKRVCSGCEVRGHCLRYAIEHNERDGVWGGMTADERAQLRRRANA